MPNALSMRHFAYQTMDTRRMFPDLCGDAWKRTLFAAQRPRAPRSVPGGDPRSRPVGTRPAFCAGSCPAAPPTLPSFSHNSAGQAPLTFRTPAGSAEGPLPPGTARQGRCAVLGRCVLTAPAVRRRCREAHVGRCPGVLTAPPGTARQGRCAVRRRCPGLQREAV
jgi:hypothetical protein